MIGVRRREMRVGEGSIFMSNACMVASAFVGLSSLVWEEGSASWLVGSMNGL